MTTPDPIYLQTLTTNAKGGTVTVELDHRTLLLGPNGSGKSAIQGAVELLLSGGVSDVAGRNEVRSIREVSALAPGKDQELVIAGRFSDGSVAGYSIRDGKRKHELPESLAGIDNFFPLQVVKDIISGSAEKASRAWMELSGATWNVREVVGQAFKGGIDAEPAEAWLFFIGLTPETNTDEFWKRPGVELLLQSRESVHQLVLTGRKSMKEIEAHLSRAQEGLGPRPTEQELLLAEDNVSKAQARAQEAVEAVTTYNAQAQAHFLAQTETAHRSPDVIESEAREITGRYQSLQVALTELQSDLGTWTQRKEELTGLAQDPPEIPEPPNELRKALYLLSNWHIQQAPSHCAACGSVSTNLPNHARAIVSQIGPQIAAAEQADQIRERWAEEDSRRCDLIREAEEKIGELQWKVADAEEEINNLAARYNELHQEYITSSAAQAEPQQDDGNATFQAEELTRLQAESAAADQAYRQAVQILEALKASEKQHLQLQTAEKEQLRVSASLAEHKALEGHISDAIERLGKRVLDSFVSLVQEAMPEGWYFGIDPETARPGLWRVPGEGLRWEHAKPETDDAQLLTALSGAEWATVTAAIATVVARRSKAPLQIITLEDRGWDPHTLRATMKALDDVPFQVILCSTVKQSHRTPSGWSVIEVDGLKPVEG